MVAKKRGRNTAKSTNTADLVKDARVKLQEARKQWDTAQEKVNGFIEENPRMAAAIAAGVGVAVGAAVASAMRKR